MQNGNVKQTAASNKISGCSGKESKQHNTLINLGKFQNVHNGDRASSASSSSLTFKNVPQNHWSRPIHKIAESSIAGTYGNMSSFL